MQATFDELYAKSKKGEVFDDLMDIILSRENILLAYRNIKGNKGSPTPGTDKLTIEDIGSRSADEVVEKVRFIVTGSKWGYRPRPVRRHMIPKENGAERPLGIPCIWDRLIQQCILQVMEPICEAKFSDNSYGFRPGRSVENAIARTYQLLQKSHLHYCVEFDIKGFFDNVDWSKLMKQIWAMGIHDTRLIWVLKSILKAPIRMPDGTMQYPTKGTPQGGIISPLLANIVLNELDHWVESQWQENPVAEKYSTSVNKQGVEIKSTGYRAMRTTALKEIYIVRYADDFRILCRTKDQANRTLIAVTQWLNDRLRLEVSPEKTRVVNVKRKYTEFLGLKIKLRQKSGKDVVQSHISDKKLRKTKKELVQQVKYIAKPRPGRAEVDEIHLYNQKVMGKQGFYHIATDISIDFGGIQRAVMTTLTNRLHGSRLSRKGRNLTPTEEKMYGKSTMLRYVAGSDEPIYPIGYVKTRKPMQNKRSVCQYTPKGRVEIHDNLRVNTGLLLELMRQPMYNRSAEFMDNRISLFSAQWGKDYVTGKEFTNVGEIHCHHKVPRWMGGTDAYGNLVLVDEDVHRLIHATEPETVQKYLDMLNLDQNAMKKLNQLRELAGTKSI